MTVTIGGLTPEDSELAGTGPAVLANRFVVVNGPAGTRIAFGEQVTTENKPIFRAAVILSYQDAIDLGKLLQQLLKPIEDQIATAQAAATPTGSGQ